MGKKTIYSIFFLLFIYAIFIRIYELGYQSFWIDEGFSSIKSLSMLTHNMLPVLGDATIKLSQYLHLLIQSISYKILGVNDFSGRLFSVIFNILSGVVLLFFTKDLFKEKNKKHYIYGVLGVMVLFFFSSREITWARQARFYSMLSFIFLLICYLLYKYFILNEKKHFKYLAIALSIGVGFHSFIWSLLLVFIILTLIKYYKENIKYSEYKTEIKWIIIAVLLLLFQKILFIYLGTGNGIMPIINDIGNLSLQYSKNYHYHLLDKLGVIYILFFAGLIWLFFKDFQKGLFFALIFGVNFYFIAYKGFLFHSRYMLHLYPIIILVGAYSFYLIVDLLFYEKNNIKKDIYIILSMFLLFKIITTYEFTFIPQKNYFIDFTSPQPDFKGAYNYLKDQDSNIISGFPHMCVRYKQQMSGQFLCKYGLKINITGHKKTKAKLDILNNELYTNIEYISGDNIKGYSVVLDNLSLKGALNRDFINTTQRDCKLVRENGEKYNFIGVRQCEED